MSPPLSRLKGGKNNKPLAVPAGCIVKGWLCGYLGKGCLQRGNVELSYMLYLISSYLMICGDGKVRDDSC